MKLKFKSVIPMLILALYALYGFSSSFYKQEIDTKKIFSPPSFHNIFGTDSIGRDLFARVGEALFYSALIGLSASLIAITIGVVIGCLMGYFSRWVDLIGMRIIEVLHMIPQFLMVSVFFLILNKTTTSSNIESVVILILSMGFCSWFNEAVSIRNMVLKIKNETYILSAQAIGAGSYTILTKHIILNLKSHIKILFLIQIPQMIMFESILSFLGIGLKAPIATFGVLAFEGWQNFLIHPYSLILSSLVLFLFILSIQSLLD